jgi:hypothetical protein
MEVALEKIQATVETMAGNIQREANLLTTYGTIRNWALLINVAVLWYVAPDRRC